MSCAKAKVAQESSRISAVFMIRFLVSGFRCWKPGSTPVLEHLRGQCGARTRAFRVETRLDARSFRNAAGVEMSLDAARMSACATDWNCVADYARAFCAAARN